jgi:hypothetical protein
MAPEELPCRQEDWYEDFVILRAKKTRASIVVVKLHQQSKGSTVMSLTITFLPSNLMDRPKNSVDKTMLRPQVLQQHYPTPNREK